MVLGVLLEVAMNGRVPKKAVSPAEVDAATDEWEPLTLFHIAAVKSLPCSVADPPSKDPG